ncbi:MAG: response regulator transcription factor [Prolixibacteraceae bacterium]|nr:response regulator transcription factor [Prolixibacteraceae bacterium]
MQLKCLIVDDEPLSQDVIVEFVEACPELVLTGVCNNALDAGKKLAEEKTDILFLDINMPKLSGIGFVKSLKKPPMIVFVTAYPEFAVDGFEVDAVDYLLKPVSFERFRASVNRILDRRLVKNEHQKAPEHIMLRASKKDYRVDFDEILFLEAQGDYVKFITTKESLMVHGTLKDFISQLPSEKFERIHKSYVISLSKVVYLEGNRLKISDYKLPVSLNFREQLMQKLK